MRPQQVENYQVPTGVIVIFYELDRTSQLSFIENMRILTIMPQFGYFYFTYIIYQILLVVLHKGSIAAWDNVFNNLYIYLSSFPIFYVFVSLLPQDFIVFELKTSRQAGRW